eukprot:1159354-Pelagomonas_calceolata.AAC.2
MGPETRAHLMSKCSNILAGCWKSDRPWTVFTVVIGWSTSDCHASVHESWNSSVPKAGAQGDASSGGVR